MKSNEEILGLSFYPHECGGMIECVTKQDALKAMSAARQDERERSKAEIDRLSKLVLELAEVASEQANCENCLEILRNLKKQHTMNKYYHRGQGEEAKQTETYQQGAERMYPSGYGFRGDLQRTAHITARQMGQKELEEAKAEVERLKGLAKRLYVTCLRNGISTWGQPLATEYEDEAWQQFKTDNNL